MKSYNPTYIAKEINEARNNPRQQALKEKLSNTGKNYLAGFAPSGDVKILINHYTCEECGKTFREEDMHSARVFCKECAAQIVEDYFGADWENQETPDDIREHIEDVKGEMEFEYQRELAAYGR